jgi:tight adherence protein C
MLFIVVGILLGTCIVLYGIVSVRQEEDRMIARLQRYELRPAQSLAELELQVPRSERLLGPVRRAMAKRVRTFTPTGSLEKLQTLLARAGNPSGLTVQDLLGLKGLAALGIGAFVFIFMTLILHPDVGKYVVFVPVGVLVGFFLPDQWLKQQVKKRQKEIQKFVADAIDILAISVEAGQGFDGALATLSSRKSNALTYEFDRFRTEVQAGKGRREALRDLGVRTGVEDLDSFVAAMIQADQLGIGIAQVLRAQAEELRIKRRQRAEEKARKAPIKMLFPLILLMFPALFVVILGPVVPMLMSMH